jgi:nucleoid DNA-binding protein
MAARKKAKKTTKRKKATRKVTKKVTKTKKKAKKASRRTTKKKRTSLKKIFKRVKNAVKLSHTQKKLPPLERVSSAFNKSQLISTLAERAELNRKQVALVMDEFCKIMGVHLKRGGPEKFVLPGAFKIVVRRIPAKKARHGINPFTGEPTIFKAKPASRKVKIVALKNLKDMAT